MGRVGNQLGGKGVIVGAEKKRLATGQGFVQRQRADHPHRQRRGKPIVILAAQVPQGQHAPPQPQRAGPCQAFAKGIQQVLHRAAHLQLHKARKGDFIALHAVAPLQRTKSEQAEGLPVPGKALVVQLGIAAAPGGVQCPLRQLLVSDGQAAPRPGIQSKNQAVHSGSFRKNKKRQPTGKCPVGCLCVVSIPAGAGKIHPVIPSPRLAFSIRFNSRSAGKIHRQKQRRIRLPDLVHLCKMLFLSFIV